jgi:hypothetical protein
VSEGLDARAKYTYTLCGWHTRSEIPLTNVPTSQSSGNGVDIRIQIALGASPLDKVANGFALAIFEHDAERSLIRIRNVADYEIKEGKHISVWPAAGAANKDIELYLFGLVWSTLCHQRGILPLHASAIATKSGITAFAGRSGAGKSTIAAVMCSLGYGLVTDDILPISFGKHSLPGAWPYLRRLKLQKDLIAELALTPIESVSERLDKDKYFVRPEFVADDRWDRLERIYLIEIDSTASTASIDRIEGSEAVRMIIERTHHFRFVVSSGQFRNHLTFCTRLASKIPIFCLRRPSSFSKKEFGFLISGHLAKQNPRKA